MTDCIHGDRNSYACNFCDKRACYSCNRRSLLWPPSGVNEDPYVVCEKCCEAALPGYEKAKAEYDDAVSKAYDAYHRKMEALRTSRKNGGGE